MNGVQTITDEDFCYCGHALVSHEEAYDCSSSFCFGTCSRCRGRPRQDSCFAPECTCTIIYGPRHKREKLEREQAETNRRMTSPTPEEIAVACKEAAGRRKRALSSEDPYRNDLLPSALAYEGTAFEITSVEELTIRTSYASVRSFRVGVSFDDPWFGKAVRKVLDRSHEEYPVPENIVTGFMSFPVYNRNGGQPSRSHALRIVRTGLAEGRKFGLYRLERDKTGFVFRLAPGSISRKLIPAE